MNILIKLTCLVGLVIAPILPKAIKADKQYPSNGLVPYQINNTDQEINFKNALVLNNEDFYLAYADNKGFKSSQESENK